MFAQPRSLAGKVAVVTGGGRGIGRAIGLALTREGVHVAIGDVDVDAAHRVAGELGGRSVGAHVDVTDRPAFTAFLDEVERRLGPIDILVNNAGIMPIVRLDEEDEASIDRQLEINLRAVVHGTREATRRMQPRGRGHIVNIASILGKAGLPGLATYAASKFGVVGFSQAAHQELRARGIDVTCVMPGAVDTDLAGGIAETGGVDKVSPADVADALIGALKRPRPEVYVPRSLGVLVAVSAVLPWRARLLMGRLTKADRSALEADGAARAGYEARAAASAPALDAGGPETAGAEASGQPPREPSAA